MATLTRITEDASTVGNQRPDTTSSSNTDPSRGAQNVQITKPILVDPPTRSYSPPSNDTHTPMEINRARFQPLRNSQRQHRLDNHLCLYYGSPSHVIHVCPIRSTRR